MESREKKNFILRIFLLFFGRSGEFVLWDVLVLCESYGEGSGYAAVVYIILTEKQCFAFIFVLFSLDYVAAFT